MFAGRYDGNITNLYQPSVNSGTSKLNGYDHRGIRSIWKWMPTDDLTFTMIGDWREADDNCCAFVPGTPPGTPPGGAAPSVAAALSGVLGPIGYQGDRTRTVNTNLVTRSLERERGLSLQTDWSVRDYTVTNIAAYRYWWFNEIRDGDNLAVTAPYVGGAFTQVHDIGPQTTSTFTEELRLTSPAHQFFEYVAGLFYYHNVQNRYFERDDVVCTSSTLAPDSTGVAPCMPGLSTSATPTANSTFGANPINVAAYGQGTLRFTHTFRGIVGLRETHDELSMYHDYNVSPISGRWRDLGDLHAAAAVPAVPGPGQHVALESVGQARGAVGHDVRRDGVSHLGQGLQGPGVQRLLQPEQRPGGAARARDLDRVRIRLEVDPARR